MSIANPPSVKLAMPFAKLRQEASGESNVWPRMRDAADAGGLPAPEQALRGIGDPSSRGSTAVAKPPAVTGHDVEADRTPGGPIEKAAEGQPLRVALSATFTLEPIE